MSKLNSFNMCSNSNESWKPMIIDIIVRQSKLIEELTNRVDNLEVDLTELEERNHALETYVVELENDIYRDFIEDDEVEPKSCKCDEYNIAQTNEKKTVVVDPTLYKFFIYNTMDKKYKT